MIEYMFLLPKIYSAPVIIDSPHFTDPSSINTPLKIIKNYLNETQFLKYYFIYNLILYTYRKLYIFTLITTARSPAAMMTA